MPPLNCGQMIVYGFPGMLGTHVQPASVGLLHPSGLILPMSLLVICLALWTIVDVRILIILLMVGWFMVSSSWVALLLIAIRLVRSRVVAG